MRAAIRARSGARSWRVAGNGDQVQQRLSAMQRLGTQAETINTYKHGSVSTQARSRTKLGLSGPGLGLAPPALSFAASSAASLANCANNTMDSMIDKKKIMLRLRRPNSSARLFSAAC